jgi:hypothetical protein
VTSTLDPRDARCPNCGYMALTQMHATWNLNRCPYWVPSRGWVAAQDLIASDKAEIDAWDPPKNLRYDSEYDTCGPLPFHGTERVGMTWNGEPAFMCPGCFENLFAAPPLEEQFVVHL